MVVVRAESGVALGTLALARLVARAQTVPAEHVEAFREHRVFALDLEHVNCREWGLKGEHASVSKAPLTWVPTFF